MYFNLKHYLSRPLEHLQKYPVFLEAIHKETEHDNPDGDYLLEAIDAIKTLQSMAQLRTFQISMGKGAPGKWEWHDLVSAEVRQALSKDEMKRQSYSILRYLFEPPLTLPQHYLRAHQGRNGVRKGFGKH